MQVRAFLICCLPARCNFPPFWWSHHFSIIWIYHIPIGMFWIYNVGMFICPLYHVIQEAHLGVSFTIHGLQHLIQRLDSPYYLIDLLLECLSVTKFSILLLSVLVLAYLFSCHSWLTNIWCNYIFLSTWLSSTI